jgi:hypothetical protein
MPRRQSSKAVTEEETKEEETEKPAPKTKAKAKVEETEEELEETKEEETEETEDEPTEDEVQDAEFFKAVDALHGEELTVEYGDVDPMSPEGIFKREQAIADRSIDSWEASIKEKSPRHYAYLMHGLNGGSDEDFFEKTKDLGSLPTEEELEIDQDIQ